MTPPRLSSRRRSRKLDSLRAIGTEEGAIANVKARRAALAIARRALDDTIIRAPHDGRVVGLTVLSGEIVAPSQTLFTLVSTEEWFAVANFRETDLNAIAVGDCATVFSMIDRRQSVKGVIQGIGWGVLDEERIDLPRAVPYVPAIVELGAGRAALPSAGSAGKSAGTTHEARGERRSRGQAWRFLLLSLAKGFYRTGAAAEAVSGPDRVRRETGAHLRTDGARRGNLSNAGAGFNDLCRFFLNKPDRGASLILNIAMLILMSLIISATILVAMVVIDQPAWRVASMTTISLGLLFMALASKLRPVAGIVALIVAYALDLLGTVHGGEIATRALLYAWLFVGIPAAVSIAVNLLLATPPVRLAEQALARRLRLAAGCCVDQMRICGATSPNAYAREMARRKNC